MKVLFFSTFFIITFSSGFSQSYLGWVTKQVNLRLGPGTNYEVISSLRPGTQAFIISLEAENDFYNIIDISTNKEGYIHKSFVKVGDVVEEDENKIFTPKSETSSYDPEVELLNNTSLTLTLKLNNETYTFNPLQKKTLTLSPGLYYYRASAAGVIPKIGTEYLESNMRVIPGNFI